MKPSLSREPEGPPCLPSLLEPGPRGTDCPGGTGRLPAIGSPTLEVAQGAARLLDWQSENVPLPPNKHFGWAGWMGLCGRCLCLFSEAINWCPLSETAKLQLGHILASGVPAMIQMLKSSAFLVVGVM